MNEWWVSGPGTSVSLVEGRSVLVGRGDDADLVVPDRRVSRRQLLITSRPDGVTVESVGAAPCFVDGAVLVGAVTVTGPVELCLVDAVEGPRIHIGPGAAVGERPPSIAAAAPPLPTAMETPPAARPEPRPSDRTEPDPVPVSAAPPVVVRIGRGVDNDLVVGDLLVSTHHAELRQVGPRTWQLSDLGSRNGTFVDGVRTAAVTLREGQTVSLGRSAFVFRAGALHVRPAGEAPAVEARGLSVVVPGGPRLLDDVSFTLRAGGMMAILGTTGAGKSTLLKALTGFRPPDAGRVLYDGRDFYRSFDALRASIGYVPQDDILHRQLTVRAALTFGAELRFPAETTLAERSQRVDEVLSDLGLAARADLPIERLSGGQRKRTSVALELLTKPAVLFLDEPTSGLDPGYEKSVMQMLRGLADGGRSVVVVTHSAASLHLCDQVLILAPGGAVAFCGSPDSALTYFGAHDFADVFSELEHGQGQDWKDRFARVDPRPPARREPRAPARLPPPPPQSWWQQVAMLCRRQAAILIADRRNLAFLGAEVLVPALLLLALVGPGSLNPSRTNSARDGRILLGALAVSAVAIGAANSLREIVKETPIYLRERAVGLMRTTYVSSKLLFIGGVTVLQVLLLVLLSAARAQGPRSAVLIGSPKLELAVGISLAAVAAVGLGLLLSAVVSSSEKAMSLVAVIFIVQWLFSGVAIDLQKKPVLRPAAYLMSANWGMAAAGSTADLRYLMPEACGPGRLRSQPPDGASGSTAAPLPSCDARWAHDPATWITSIVALLALTAIALWATGLVLDRREPVRSNVPEPSPFNRLRLRIARAIGG